MPHLPYIDPIPLPAPAWLLWSLLMLTFSLHVAAMNLLLGGAIIGAVSRVRGRRSAEAKRLSALVAHALPVLVAATVTFGVAALLFLQVLYGRLFFAAAVLLAVPWFAVIVILVAAYYGAYYASLRAKAGAIGGAAAAWVLAAGFAAVGFIYSNVMSLVLRPGEFVARAQASGSGLHLNLADPTLIPRYLHVLVGAMAVAGLGIALWGVVVRRRDPVFGSWMTGHGVFWAAGATMVNFLPGFWWLAALPREALLGLLGQNPVAAILFAVAILASLAALGLLVPASFAPDPTRLLLGAAAALSVTLVSMVLVRDAARRMILEPAGYRVTNWVEPQWGPIAIFAVLLVAAIATVAWMVVKLARGASGSGAVSVGAEGTAAVEQS